MLNLIHLTPGQRLHLRDGRQAEVVENIGDGIWVQARFLDAQGVAEVDDEGELLHCEEVAGLVEAD